MKMDMTMGAITMRHGDKATERALPSARQFFLVDLATVLFVVWAVSDAAGWLAGFGSLLLWLCWAGLLGLLFLRRGQDEFWQLCWRRAAVTTLAGLLFIPVLWAFGHGLYEGFMTEAARDAGRPPPARGQDINDDLDVLLTVLFTIFFARFQWTRFRGGMD